MIKFKPAVIVICLAAHIAAAETIATATQSLAPLQVQTTNPSFLFKANEDILLSHTMATKNISAATVELSVEIKTTDGQWIESKRQEIALDPASSEIAMPYRVETKLNPGFYEVLVRVFDGERLVTELRYGFGFSAENIKPKTRRPKDFDVFWKSTTEELEVIAPRYTIDSDPTNSDGKTSCFKVSYFSLRQNLIHGWYCHPNRGGNFPGLLINPWYGEKEVRAPKYIAELGYAVLAYQARGFEVNQSSYPRENSSYMTLGIENPKTYVFRDIIAHAIRGIDFLYAQSEVDKKRIGTAGPSQGGGLSLILAGLDYRVTAAAADFPFLSCFELALPQADYPYKEIEDYLRENPDKRDATMETLSYFDALNFANKIQVPVLINMGLLDHICPPASVIATYNSIRGSKKLKTYPTATHNDQNSLRWWNAIGFLNENLSPQTP